PYAVDGRRSTHSRRDSTDGRAARRRRSCDASRDARPCSPARLTGRALAYTVSAGDAAHVFASADGGSAAGRPAGRSGRVFPGAEGLLSAPSGSPQRAGACCRAPPVGLAAATTERRLALRRRGSWFGTTTVECTLVRD